MSDSCTMQLRKVLLNLFVHCYLVNGCWFHCDVVSTTVSCRHIDIACLVDRVISQLGLCCIVFDVFYQINS